MQPRVGGRAGVRGVELISVCLRPDWQTNRAGYKPLGRSRCLVADKRAWQATWVINWANFSSSRAGLIVDLVLKSSNRGDKLSRVDLDG